MEAETVESAARPAKDQPGVRSRPVARFIQQFALIPVLAVAMVVGSFVHDAFLTKANLVNVLQQSSELAVIVLAEALILIVGKFDLSLESTVGIAPMFGAWLVATPAIGGLGLGINPYLIIAVMLATGMAIGLFNGWMVAKLKLNAFMVTLAMLILLRGVTIGLTNGRTLYDLPTPITYLGSARWLGVPASVWLAGFLFLVVGLFLRYHSFGRSIYAIGGNAEAARAAGIRVERVIWTVYIAGSGLAAFAGVLLTGRLASVLSGQGQNMIFTVFAACVIGGISLSGGRGTMFGALTGVLLLGIIANILTLSQIQSYWIDAAFGAVILIALVIAHVTSGGEQET
ncbi:MAG TPA: ABC transporter permease [Acidimicrobiia bacterium]|nr:ABC transporter permease [Acidimicrobiia bacterium]